MQFSHPILKDLPSSQLETMTKSATIHRYSSQEYLFHQYGEARTFYLIRKGRVSIEIASSQATHISLQVLEPGELLGWSWLLQPHVWEFDARALELVETIELDGEALRQEADADPVFGYHLFQSVCRLAVERVKTLRMRMLEDYHRRAS